MIDTQSNVPAPREPVARALLAEGLTDDAALLVHAHATTAAPAPVPAPRQAMRPR